MTKIREFLERYLVVFSVFFRLRKIADPDRILLLIRALRPVLIDIPLVRIGSASDGGYLIPDDTDKIEAIFSPGVGNKHDFDKALLVQGKRLFLADASVEKPQDLSECVFDKKYIGGADHDDFVSLESWVISHAGNHADNLLLQMDIEGFEYAAILSCDKEVLKRFRTIIIEFHDLDQLFCKFSHNIIRDTFFKLLEFFDVVHIHPNNCKVATVSGKLVIPPVMEFTFHRKDAHRVLGHSLHFPHPFDAECTSKTPLPLPKIWYADDS